MPDKPPRVVACPTCGKPVEWLPENRYRPFCCERCKLIDMGEWAAERYRVTVEEVPADEPQDGRPT
ncbi:MAG TPA: DNA gyrase inhibitor YacG [Thiobacillaceae bacterium]|nr:DNA gyrase inhibitor YacG [Thiobacillaceae bacterium]